MTTSITNAPLSEYERAVCYYTLPRVVSPATIGLIAAYLVCLLEAIAALAFGIIRNDPTWTKWGVFCLAAIIVLGVVAFIVRSFLNEVRRRRLLASAETIPDPTSGFDDLPDPFAEHLLLRFEPHRRSNAVPVEDNFGRQRYTVSTDEASKCQTVTCADTDETFNVKVDRRGVSFRLGSSLAGGAVVRQGDRAIATVRQRFSLMGPLYEIENRTPEPTLYTVRAGAIHLGDGQLVGRVYELRQRKYLDIDASHLNPGVLSYFLFVS